MWQPIKLFKVDSFNIPKNVYINWECFQSKCNEWGVEIISFPFIANDGQIKCLVKHPSGLEIIKNLGYCCIEFEQFDAGELPNSLVYEEIEKCLMAGKSMKLNREQYNILLDYWNDNPNPKLQNNLVVVKLHEDLIELMTGETLGKELRRWLND